MYQRGLLDSRQKHFVTAKDFDKYVNHNLKIKLPWIDKCGSKARKKALVNAENAFKKFFDGLAGFPRFKKKSNQDVKLYFPKNNKGDWKIWRHKLMIPTLKQVRLKEYGYLPDAHLHRMLCASGRSLCPHRSTNQEGRCGQTQQRHL